MKLTFPTLRIAAALGLAAGMMIGCQDLLNPGAAASDPGVTATDQSGALSLSIKNDSSCQSEWHSILAARSAGHPDSASEAGFLAACVTEVKPVKDKPMPVIPPPLLPDSGTRCKWIVSQIEGGRDSLSVSYRKYCPDDCRKLEANDSASHEKLCRDPKPHGDDSLPPKPPKMDSLPPKPHGDDTLPPKTGPEDDTCKMLLVKLETVKPGEPGRADLERLFTLRCHEPVPHDSIPALPPPPKPPTLDSICMDLRIRLATTAPGTAGRSDLEAAFKAKCMEPLPVAPPIDCDEARAKLATLDTTSVDYVHLISLMKSYCPAVP